MPAARIELPAGLTERPLVPPTPRAVSAVMAAQELARHRRGRHRGGRHRGRLAAARATTSPPARVGVFDGDRLVAYAEVIDGGRGDAAVHPDLPRPRASAPPSPRWMQETARGARAPTVIGMPVPQGSPRRPAARGARLPRALDQLGAPAAGGRDGPAARRCRTGTPCARPRRTTTEPCWTVSGGRLPRVVGARARDLRGLAGRDRRPPRLRAVAPAGRHRPRRRGRRHGDAGAGR